MSSFSDLLQLNFQAQLHILQERRLTCKNLVNFWSCFYAFAWFPLVFQEDICPYFKKNVSNQVPPYSAQSQTIDKPPSILPTFTSGYASTGCLKISYMGLGPVFTQFYSFCTRRCTFIIKTHALYLTKIYLFIGLGSKAFCWRGIRPIALVYNTKLFMVPRNMWPKSHQDKPISISISCRWYIHRLGEENYDTLKQQVARE